MRNAKRIAAFGGEAFGAYSALRQLRRARQKGDRLHLANALLNLAVVATGIVLTIRELRGADEKEGSGR
jgi:hypothetical protein